MTEQHKPSTIFTRDRAQEISGRTSTVQEDRIEGHHPAAIGSLMIPDPSPTLSKNHSSNIKPKENYDATVNLYNQHVSSSSEINVVLDISTQSAVTKKEREEPPRKEMPKIAVSAQKSDDISNELNKGCGVLLGDVHTPLNQPQSSVRPKAHSLLEGQSQSVCSSRLEIATSCLERKSNESNLSTDGAKYGALQGDFHNNSNGFICDKNTKTELYTQTAPIYCVSVTLQLADSSQKENCCATNRNNASGSVSDDSELSTSTTCPISSINFHGYSLTTGGNSLNKQTNHENLSVSKSKTQQHDGGRDETKTNTFVFSESSCLDKFHEETTSNLNCDKDRSSTAEVKQSSLDEILSSLEKIRDEFELSSTELENTTTSKTLSGKEAPVASLSECFSGFREAKFASESATNKEVVHALGCEYVFADLSKISCDNVSVNKPERHNSTCFLKHPSESIEKNYVTNSEKDSCWNSFSLCDTHHSENASEMLSSPLLSQKPCVNGFTKFLSQLKVKCRDPLKAENAVIMKKWGLNDSQQPSIDVYEIKKRVPELLLNQDQSNNNSEFVICQEKSELDTAADLKPGQINYEILGGKSEIATKNNNKPPEPKVEQIQHILAGLDFSKYRRGRNICDTDEQENSSVGMESKHSQNIDLKAEVEHIASHHIGIEMDTSNDNVRIVDQLESQQDRSVVVNNTFLKQDAVLLDVVSFCPEIKRYRNEKGKNSEVSKNINKCINSNSLFYQHNVKESERFLEQSGKDVADSSSPSLSHNLKKDVADSSSPSLSNHNSKKDAADCSSSLSHNLKKDVADSSSPSLSNHNSKKDVADSSSSSLSHNLKKDVADCSSSSLSHNLKKDVADSSSSSLSHHDYKGKSEKLKNVSEKIKPTLYNSSAKTFIFNANDALKCNNGIMRKFSPINRSSSFPQVKVFSDNSYEKTKISSGKSQPTEFNQQYLSSRRILNNPSTVVDNNKYIDTAAQQSDLQVISSDLNKSDLSVDSAIESVNEENFVVDSDSYLNDKPSSYSILPPTNKTMLLSDECRQFSGSEINKEIKVVRPFKVDFKPNFQEVKNEDNESLSYPSQCRKSVLEEEIQQSSALDINTLSPIDTSLTLAVRSLPQKSVLSLSDSYFNRDVIVGHETFEHTVGMITHSTSEMCSAKRSEKLLKKKYHSDPNGSINRESVEFDEIVSRYKSEPVLGDGNEERHQHQIMLRGRKTPIELYSLASLIPQQSSSHGFGNTSSCFSKQPSFAECANNCNLEKEKLSKSPDQQMRYSKKRLRGPYGEMLEEEMRKSGEKLKHKMDEDLRYLEETSEESTLQKTTYAIETSAKFSESELHVRPFHLPSSQSLDQVDIQKSSTCIDTDTCNKNTSANILYVQSGKASTRLISSISMSSFSSDSTYSETNTVISSEDTAKPDRLLTADNCGAAVLQNKDHYKLERVVSLKKHQVHIFSTSYGNRFGLDKE
ncbi:uncharacterized protein LOC106474602 [Limulus polyphemus]|uniref:Uncharacterized protein LOC106474602 n=1 Tax=Limulus polyphemus TaxID=6850 RepID=A0ABM1BXV4_LIMPO|nr:uncharacterized protein LOC106474602 [Limulus polyphemus]